MCGKDRLALVARECTDLGERWLSPRGWKRLKAGTQGRSLASQVPTPITEMEISSQKGKSSCRAAKSSFL